MRVQRLALPEVMVLTPERHADARGFFSETWSRAGLAAEGLDIDFVQENHSLSRDAGTVRGLHYQSPPFAQDKLLRVVRGRIWDVAVDLRRASATYGRWVAAEIGAEAWTQILVPRGFAHGFCTLEPDTEVVYLVSAPYASAHDHTLRWNDPALGIAWPVEPHEVVLSAKDRAAPLLAQIASPF